MRLIYRSDGVANLRAFPRIWQEELLSTSK